jgi:hypothetical protein
LVGAGVKVGRAAARLTFSGTGIARGGDIIGRGTTGVAARREVLASGGLEGLLYLLVMLTIVTGVIIVLYVPPECCPIVSSY